MSSLPPPAPEPAENRAADWFLQLLVTWTDSLPIKFGITLNVGGFLVSGDLISGAEYFKGFASDFSGGLAGNPETAEAFRKTITRLGEETYKADGKDAEHQRLPSYIHLKDARFFSTTGNPIPGNRGVWWRGRISEVSGFILGSLGETR